MDIESKLVLGGEGQYMGGEMGSSGVLETIHCSVVFRMLL